MQACWRAGVLAAEPWAHRGSALSSVGEGWGAAPTSGACMLGHVPMTTASMSGSSTTARQSSVA